MVHRRLAMLVGFALLATLYLAWRDQDDRRVKWAVTAAVGLLPSQIILGALTVTEFTAVITAAHFVTASLIILCLTGACAWTIETPSVDALRTLVIAAIALVPLHLVLDGSIVVMPLWALVGFYAVSFLLSCGLAWCAVGARARPRSRPVVSGCRGAATWLDMLVARRKFGLDQALTDVGAVVVLLVLIAAVWTLSKHSTASGLGAVRAD